jgi:hypothetical protein
MAQRDEQTRIQSVLDDPEADEPRNALAALYEERGDPRGKFIRLQQRVAEIRRSDVSRSEWMPYADEAKEIRTIDGIFWLKPVALLLADEVIDEAQFHRGFVEEVWLDARQFLDHAGEIYRLAPVRRLRLTGVAPVARELFASPHLDRIVVLWLDENGLGDDEVAALAASLYLGRLAWLDLGENRIGAPGIEALVASTRLPRLAYIRLVNNPAEDPRERFFTDDRNQIDDTEATPVGEELERRFGYRAWLHSPSLHPRAFPPGADDVIAAPAARDLR